jgi:hypothetical protein
MARMILALSTLLLFAGFSRGQTGKKMTDYLKVPGPVVFDQTPYHLSWTSHPSATFYKQEYLPKGETADQFRSMLLIDVVSGKLGVSDAVAAKLAEIKKIKETNPAVYYETFDNTKTGEYMIDFLLTANTPDGKINIAERNVYRYKAITDAAGRKAVLLFGVSIRSYNDGTTAFIAALKTNKKELVNQVAHFTIPVIKLNE